MSPICLLPWDPACLHLSTCAPACPLPCPILSLCPCLPLTVPCRVQSTQAVRFFRQRQHHHQGSGWGDEVRGLGGRFTSSKTREEGVSLQGSRKRCIKHSWAQIIFILYMTKQFFKFLKITFLALASMAQFVEHLLEHQNIANLIHGQDTCLGFGPNS